VVVASVAVDISVAGVNRAAAVAIEVDRSSAVVVAVDRVDYRGTAVAVAVAMVRWLVVDST